MEQVTSSLVTPVITSSFNTTSSFVALENTPSLNASSSITILNTPPFTVSSSITPLNTPVSSSITSSLNKVTYKGPIFNPKMRRYLDDGKLLKFVELKDSDKNIAYLKKELDYIKRKLAAIEINQLVKELKLPKEIVQTILPNSRITQTGKGTVPLLESDILNAQEHSHNASEAARYLHVNVVTYKKYAQMYGIYKTNSRYRPKHFGNPETGKYPLTKILNNEIPNCPVYRIKDKLIRSGLKKAECEQCGYKERRISDGKIPLLVNFQDGNPKNFKLENLKILCYNCTFCSGGADGYTKKGVPYKIMDFDPDRTQGAKMDIPTRF